MDAGERQLLLGRQGLAAKEKNLEIGERAAQLGAQRLVGDMGEIDAMDRCADQGTDRLDLENLVAGELGVKKSHGFVLRLGRGRRSCRKFTRRSSRPANVRHLPPA
jgi:hypothetical protein